MQTFIKSVQETLLQTDVFVIPCYQRPYSWEQEQIQALIYDIENYAQTESTEPCFLGSIIYLRTDQDHFELIDGQQRITTLFLMLKAWSEKFNFVVKSSLSPSSELLELRERLQHIILRHGSVPLKTLVHADISQTSQSFASIMLAESISLEMCEEFQYSDDTYKKNYAQCAQWIDTYWASHESQEVYRLVNLLLEKTILISLRLDNLESAIKIFETLNTRGQELSDSDLFKIIIFSNCSTLVAKSDFSQKWDRLEQYCQINEYKMSDLFYDLMLIKLAQSSQASSEDTSLRQFWSKYNYQNLRQQDYNSLLHDLNLMLDFKLLPFYLDTAYKSEIKFNDSEIKAENWFKDFELLKSCYLILINGQLNEQWILPLQCYWFRYHKEPNFERNFKLFTQRLVLALVTYLYTGGDNTKVKSLLNRLSKDVFKEKLPHSGLFAQLPQLKDNIRFKQAVIGRNPLEEKFAYDFSWYCLMIVALAHKEQNGIPNYKSWPRMHPIVTQDNTQDADKSGISWVNHIGNQAFVYQQNFNESRPMTRAEKLQHSCIKDSDLESKVPLAMNNYIFSDQGANSEINLWGMHTLKKIAERDQYIYDTLCAILQGWGEEYERALKHH